MCRVGVWNNKNELRTIYPKNHEHFKNSKPRGQILLVLIKKERNNKMKQELVTQELE